jgi:hypothetical protein
MGNATSLSFDLDGFRVLSVDLVAGDGSGELREVLVEGVADEQACPSCGVFSAAVHSRRVRVIKDLPFG